MSATVSKKKPEKAIRILLVDDHQLVAEGISSLLSESTFTSAIGAKTIVESSHSVSDALTCLQKGNTYQLILLDLSMPKVSGFELLKYMREEDIETPVIVLSASESTPDMQRAYQLGAKGYICKFEPAETMLAKIIKVTKGNHSFPDIFYQQLQVKSADIEPVPELTRRQIEVLELVAEGKSNKQISNALDVSEATVKFHITDIFRLLNVHNRTLCVKEATEKGIIG